MPPEESCTFTIRVQPRSSKNAVELQSDGTLKLWITAPPVDGEANSAVCGLLAKRLKIAPSLVSIVSGEKGRTKRIRVTNISEAQALDLLRTS